jgi:hypothetical protein
MFFLLLFIFLFFLRYIRAVVFTITIFEWILKYLDLVIIYKSGLWYLLFWLYRSVTFVVIMSLTYLILIILFKFIFSSIKFLFIYMPFVTEFYMYYTYYVLRGFKFYLDLYKHFISVYIKKISLFWLKAQYYDSELGEHWYTFYLQNTKIDQAVRRLSIRHNSVYYNILTCVNMLIQLLVFILIRVYLKADLRLFEVILGLYTQFFIWVCDSLPMPMFLNKPITFEKNTPSILENVQLMVAYFKKNVISSYIGYKKAPTILIFLSDLNMLLIKYILEKVIDLEQYCLLVARIVFQRLEINIFFDQQYINESVISDNLTDESINANSARYSRFLKLFWEEYRRLDILTNRGILFLEPKLHDTKNLSLEEFLKIHNNLMFDTAKKAILFLTPIQCLVVACNTNYFLKKLKFIIIFILLKLEKRRLIRKH